MIQLAVDLMNSGEFNDEVAATVVTAGQLTAFRDKIVDWLNDNPLFLP